jgi:penicillin-binding protein 1C
LYVNDCALNRGNCYSSLKLRPQVAYIITDILSDNQARAGAFGLYSVLNIPGQEVAVKMEQQQYEDNWTIGYKQID